jgi:hypothetical protein
MVRVGATNGDGDRLPAEQMGMATGGWYSTGASGTASGNVAEASAPPLATVPVAPGNYPDSPLASARPVATVSVGDSSNYSSDHPYGDVNDMERISGVTLDTGGSGAFQPAGMRPVDLNQATYHPNAGK